MLPVQASYANNTVKIIKLVFTYIYYYKYACILNSWHFFHKNYTFSEYLAICNIIYQAILGQIITEPKKRWNKWMKKIWYEQD